MISTTGNLSSYKKILIPVTESLNTRKSVYLSVLIAKSEGSSIVICDLRNFDRKKVHGFKSFMEEKPWESLGVETEIITRNSESARDTTMQFLYSTGADCVVLGVRPDEYHNIRVNSNIKRIIKDFSQDSILVKR